MVIKLFFRKNADGHTIIFGKALGELNSENEIVFEGTLNVSEEVFILQGKSRKPVIETESYSVTTLMRDLGDL